jgi:prolyl-tRNA editing enzyme YbaK/EbsC (Cys-tRNA(Pro) deacylase)
MSEPPPLDTSEPGAPAALPEPPGAPWVTMVTTLLVLFVFGGLVVAVFHYADRLAYKPAAATTGEQQLRELRASEQELLTTTGYDAETKTYRVPIDRAMDELTREYTAAGELRSFPAAKKKK